MRAVHHILILAAACFMSGCASSQNSKPGLALEGTLWRLIELNGQPVRPTLGLSVPTLQLNAESHRATGVSGINRYSGGYELSGSGIKFGTLAGTRMAGPPEAMAVETAFLNALASANSWRISGNQLVLKTAGKDHLRFQVD